MAIIDFTQGSPYVHTYVTNFLRNYKSIGNIYNQSNVWENLLSQKIYQLETLRDQLKAGAEEFTNGLSPEEFSRIIFNNNETYSGIARQILRSREMQALLTPEIYINKAGEAMTNAISEILFNSNESSIILSDAVNQIMEKVGKNKKITNKNTKADTQIKELANMLGLDPKEIAKAYKTSATKHLKVEGKSKNTKLRSIVKEELKKMGTSNEAGLEKAIEYFKVQFLSRPEIVEITKTAYKGNDSPENYVKRVADILRNPWKLGTKTKNRITINSAAQASGALAEDWTLAIYEADTSATFEADFTLYGTGSFTEKEVRDFTNAVGGYTRKYSEKQSYGDMVLKNSKGKVTYIQSKNFVSILEDVLTQKGERAAYIKLAKDLNFTTLLKYLQDNNNAIGITPEEAEIFSYLVVNLAWFKTYRTMKHKNTSRYGDDSKSSTSEVENLITMFLTAEVTNFLGIVIDESFTVQPDVSNLFFLMGNASLVPTYVIIDGIIKSFNADVKEQIYRIKPKFNYRSISWAYSTQRGLWNAKSAAIHNKKGSDNYTGTRYSDNMLAVGKKQGRSAVNSLTVSNVSLNFNLREILTSAYGFTISGKQ